MPIPPHLNNHHRDTVSEILRHPTSHNIEWRRVLSLLEHVADTADTRGNKVTVTLGGETLTVTRPPDGGSLDAQQVVDLRNLLLSAGFA